MVEWGRIINIGWRFALAFFLLCTLSGCLPLATSLDTDRVARVIDGDTIILSGGERVRYIGIDTPEMDPEEPFAVQATQANRELVEGKPVRLERDVSETDKYGRLLRYIWVDEKLVNLELVRLGLAEAKAYPPDVRYQSLLDAAETEAKLTGRGMWRK